MTFSTLPIRDTDSPREAAAMDYLATRTEAEILESIARVNESRSKLGLAPIGEAAAARMLAQGRR